MTIFAETDECVYLVLSDEKRSRLTSHIDEIFQCNLRVDGKFIENNLDGSPKSILFYTSSYIDEYDRFRSSFVAFLRSYQLARRSRNPSPPPSNWCDAMVPNFIRP